MDNGPIFQSKNEQVYGLLKSKIVRGELKPGEAIVIDTLAKQLGVSQIPIREALRHLEAIGFVHIAPYVGARVTEIQASSIYEVFALLESMEVLSGRAACLAMSEDDLEQLGQIIRQMSGLVKNPDAWSDNNKRLHQFICQKAGMHLVEKMLLVALDHWDRLRCYYLEDVFAQGVTARQAEHEAMLAALRQHDPDQVERVLHQHNQEALRAYIAHLEKTQVLTANN